MSKLCKKLGDRYLLYIDEKLGKGMYSEVYKGMDMKT